jgi:superfamily II DNA helicase RecQ
VSYLLSLDLPAATLNSTLPSKERERIYQDLNCGHPRTRLLYITPELASKGGFRKTLQKIYRNGELSRFVIDEGHCISEWGHDFRKDYRSLSYFRLVHSRLCNLTQNFPNVPIMVLTATATEKSSLPLCIIVLMVEFV